MASKDLVCLIEMNIIVPIFQLLCAGLMSYFIYRYVKLQRTTKNKHLYYVGLALFFTQIAYLLVVVVNHLFYCSDNGQAINSQVAPISDGLYLIQYAILLWLLFYRLKSIFDATEFCLSRSTVIAFTTLHVFTILVSAIFWVSWRKPSSYFGRWLIFTSPLLTVLLVSMVAMLSFLFVHKLVVVNRANSKSLQSDKKMIMVATITKISVLTSISVVSFAIFATFTICMIFTEASNSIHGWFAWELVGTFDACTNFISVVLTFSGFKKYYYKVCSCCDMKCRELCKSVIGSVEFEMSTVIRATSQDTHVDFESTSPTCPTSETQSTI